MGKEAERSAILSELSSVWPVSYGPMSYPNAPFNPPKNTRWAACEILTLFTTRVSLGRDTFLKRTKGILQIDLFVPNGLGTKEAREVADFLENHFQDLILTAAGDNVEFHTPQSKTLPTNVARAENIEDNWYRYVVECPFTRDTHVNK